MLDAFFRQTIRYSLKVAMKNATIAKASLGIHKNIIEMIEVEET